MKRTVSCLILLIFFCSPGLAETIQEVLIEASGIIRAGDFEKAYKKIRNESLELENPSADPDYNYALGRLSYEMGQLEEAQKHFNQLLKGKGIFQSWAKFYLGSIARQKQENKTAKSKLLALAGRRQPTRLRLDARKELALAALQRKHYREARRHLYYLERRNRGGALYPQIMSWLIEAELGSRRKWKACRYARKLYARYPAHEITSGWGVTLQDVQFNGKKMNCIATTADTRRRIERLQLAGRAGQAAAEIVLLRSRVKRESVYLDLLEARFHYRQGDVDKSLELLLKHYQTQKRSTAYLMQLAKVALVAGEYHAAVAAYELAHKRRPRSMAGKKALFQAAFASYRAQDYDGAIRRFEIFNRKYRRSGLTRDAAWHLAWVKYLKGDYKGAYRKFSWILRQKNRYKWRWRSFAKDRLQYWMAMSLYRNGETRKAAELFAGLFNENSISYYSLLSRKRLSEIEDPQIRKLASVKAVFEENPFTEDKVAETEPDVPEPLEDEESEETLGQASEEEEPEIQVGDNEEEGEEIESEEEDHADAEFKSKKLARHFERAKKFIEMGFDDSARWELYEIERKTRKEEQLKALMYHYQLIRSYHRSSYVGEIYFSRQRHRYGIAGVKYLWEYTYPQAYKDHVEEFSGRFSIPKELTWSIIRAESRYRKDAVSPVGARGLMQMMPYTAEKVAQLVGAEFDNPTRLEEPEYNIQFGTRYLQRLMKKFKEKVPLVAAGYNAGPHRVDQWLNDLGHLEMDEFVEHIPFVETRKYVKKVARNYHVYSTLYEEGRAKMPWLIGPISVRPTTTQFTKESWEVIN